MKEVVVIKRNIPYVVVSPLKKKKEKAFGRLKGMAKYNGDIVAPIEEQWVACS